MKIASSFRPAGLVSLAAFLAGLAALAALCVNGVAIDPEKGREALIAAIWNHVRWGAVSAPALLAWVAWRLFAGAPPRASLMDKLGVALLILIAAAVTFLIISGPLTVWSYGRALKVFGWFAIPSPMSAAPEFHGVIEQAHVFAARALPWLIGAEAALFAYFRVRKRAT